MHGFHRRHIALGLGFLIIGSTGFAQETQITQKNRLTLEEVLVTAQKQEQDLQDTPIAVDAISAEEFANYQSFDLGDIDRLTAGVDISGDAFNIDFQVRGIGTNLDAGTSPRVTIYKDGAFFNQQRAAFLTQYDLKRFELLRGPQGTLYGKASPAGSLVILTADPSTTDWDGYITTSVFSGDGFRTEFGQSIPVIKEKMGLRISGNFDKNNRSDVKNETLGEEEIKRTSAGRLTGIWFPNEKVDMRLSYNYTENTGDFYTVTAQNGFKPEDRRSFDNVPGAFIRIYDEHTVGTLNYALTEDITLTWVGFHQELRTVRSFDNDAGAGPGPQTLQNVDSNIGKVVNSEFRIHSTANEKWDWITGIYYQNSRARTDVLALTTDFGIQLAPPPAPAAPGQNRFEIFPLNQTEEFALFHHSGFQLSPTQKLTVGIRYNDTSINARSPFTSTTSANFGAGFAPIASSSGEGIPLENEKRRFSEFTGTVKFQQNFGDNHTGYVSIDRGWRNASAVVDANGTVPAELVLHDDEPTLNIEFGIKGSLWNDRAKYTAALFTQDYQDFQFQADGIPVDTNGSGNSAGPQGPQTFNAIVNAPRVTSSGVEASLTGIIKEGWLASAAVSYNDVKFEKFDEAPCDRGSTIDGPRTYNTCDFSGQRVTDAPNWSAVVTSEYVAPLTSSTEWYVRGLTKYDGARADPSSNDKIGSSVELDLFAGARAVSGRWDVSLWAKNVTDEDNIEDIDINSSGTKTYRINDPMTVGITGTWRHGLGD